MKTKLTAFLLLLFFILFSDMSSAAYAEEEPANDKARSEEFMDWGLGMFIHWSFDSQLGSVISHSMVGASEKYLDHFINELPKTFNPVEYNAERWMQLFKRAGCKYAVFTTKHHSGFCMWHTETTEFCIRNTPYKKDIVEQFVAACRNNGIKVGFYFSPEDFYFLHRQGHVIRRKAAYANISSNPELFAYNKKQVRELVTKYGTIDLFFLDGFDNKGIARYIHELSPATLITRGEMATPEQKIPNAPMPGPWEACFTLGNQWQYKPTNEEYKSGTKLIEMLIETRAKGGNLLINTGPHPLGFIPYEQECRFRELALWMFVNDEAVHSIRPCPVIHEGDLWFTRTKDTDTVYIFLTRQENWKRGSRREFSVKSLKATSRTKISVLGQNDKVVEYNPKADPKSRILQKSGPLTFSVVRAQRLYNNQKWPNPVVVKFTNVVFIK